MTPLEVEIADLHRWNDHFERFFTDGAPSKLCHGERRQEAHTPMKLREASFKQPYAAYFAVTNERDSDVNEWELVPLMGPTLAAAYVPSRRLEGEFVVASKIIGVAGIHENCDMSVVLPERVPEWRFRLQGDRIVRGRGGRVHSGTIVPSIAIETIGTYTLYLAEGQFTESIEVLRDGLAQAREKGPVALDLAYVLRDAGRNHEAIEAFTIAISRLSVDAFTRAFYYRERAAAADRVEAESLQGKHTRLDSSAGQPPMWPRIW